MNYAATILIFSNPPNELLWFSFTPFVFALFTIFASITVSWLCCDLLLYINISCNKKLTFPSNFYYIINMNTSGGSTVQSGLLGTPIKLSVQLLELASSSTAVDEIASSWTVDSINTMYLTKQQSQSESAPSDARTQSQKNLINLPPLHQVRTLDLWLSSSMSLTAACQTAARRLGLDPSR